MSTFQNSASPSEAPMKMEQTERFKCWLLTSGTSESPQITMNHPEERTQHSEHFERLKSRIIHYFSLK
jgi:hypothetical protein